MARTEAQIIPSPEARSLFNVMVARSEEDGHLPLNKTLELAVERSKRGQKDMSAIVELQSEEWIKEAPDGGWMLR